MRSEPSPSGTKDIVIGAGVLILLATVVVVCARLLAPEPNELEMVDPPEQNWIRTGPERAFLSDLTELGVFSDESTLLAVGEVWCTGKRAGQGTEEVIDRMRHLTLLASLDPREVKPIAGAATLRLCPEQGAALDAHYGEK